MGGHSRFLVQELGFDQSEVQAMRSGHGGRLTAEQRTLVSFVRRIAADPRRTVPDDVEALYAAGWTPAEIVEAIAMAMLSAFTNCLAASLHFEEDVQKLDIDGYF